MREGVVKPVSLKEFEVKLGQQRWVCFKRGGAALVGVPGPLLRERTRKVEGDVMRCTGFRWSPRFCGAYSVSKSLSQCNFDVKI